MLLCLMSSFENCFNFNVFMILNMIVLGFKWKKNCGDMPSALTFKIFHMREREREREREYDIRVNRIIKCMVNPKTGLFRDRILIRYTDR